MSISRAANLIRTVQNNTRVLGRLQHAQSSASSDADYAFEMACSNIRYGPGVLNEVGMDLKNLGAKNVCVVTDKNINKLPPMDVVRKSLDRQNINFTVYDDVRVEPTNESFQHSIDFAKLHKFDSFLAVGGGSVIDTCKVANLYMSSPTAELLDYVNAPIGKAKPITHPLMPLIAVPTTAGTGSETTGVSIFDYLPLNSKTGIASRALKPMLGIVDPLVLKYLPNRVACYSGLDVLCHALESYTAIPFNERKPRPLNPINRPAYQGSNPISDVWAKQALHSCRKYIKEAVYDCENMVARSEMHLASVFAGIGFGNAGVHLCHGMSYPISGLVKSFKSPDYTVDHPLVPHGLSVIITAPAVFRFTSVACPDRHLQAAEILGADIAGVKRVDAGKCLAEIITKYMSDLEVPNGLIALGYDTSDIPALVKGTLPQERVTKIAPRPQQEEDLAVILEESMKNY